jgi:DNA mismatch endonuclease (patch repair protein)
MMADVHTPAQRSYNMSRIRSKDTKPEIIVRSALHRLGYRFRLHREDLPGKPDIVLPKHNTVIFVHGCYWHRHRCRYGQVVPQTRREFWKAKFAANVDRDKRKREAIRALGWRVLTVWECQTGDRLALEELLSAILGS